MTKLMLVADRTFRSLRIRNYRLYFFGQVVSFTGTWVQSVAQMWLVLEMTGSGVALGIVTALQFLPMLLFGIWGGVIADRFDKRKVLMWTQSAGAALALFLAVLSLTDVLTLWMIYSFALALGFVTVVDNPTRQSFAVEMVGPPDLSNVVGLNSTIFTSARMLGPALAAVLIAAFGVTVCFFINAASYVAVIGSLYAMRPEELHRSDPVPRSKGQLRAGVRYVWTRPELRSAILLVSIIGTFAFNFRILLPLMARTTFDGDAGTYGALAAMMGAGTVMGALGVASRVRPRRRVLIGSALAYGVMIIAAGAAPTIEIELALLVPMGAAGIAFLSTANAMMQLNSTDSMRGRVMALYAVVFLGSTPIGSPITGWLAETVGIRGTFYITGALTIAAALVALQWARRQRDLAAVADTGERAVNVAA
ncbi:MAG: MFS transporter [Actinomycetota bacterium]|nr:MFS transporter [Actinomycetota bacterium]